MTPSRTHLVMIPAFNPGRLLEQTVNAALERWGTVWVIVDGSTDQSHADLKSGSDSDLKVIVSPVNQGKGAAVLHGAMQAMGEGFSHALVMDADGQHPAERIADFMAASEANPGAVISETPFFGPEAPWIRLVGGKLSVVLVRFESAGVAPPQTPCLGSGFTRLRPWCGCWGRPVAQGAMTLTRKRRSAWHGAACPRSISTPDVCMSPGRTAASRTFDIFGTTSG